MTARIDYISHPAVRGLHRIHTAVQESALDPTLLELVKMRASQLNGCAYCIDMHAKDARAAGEGEQRLHGLPAWHEAPYYTDAERAALALTEAVTRIGDGVPDAVLDDVERHFSADEVTALLYAIVEINAWNRLAITARTPAGSYEPDVRQPVDA